VHEYASGNQKKTVLKEHELEEYSGIKKVGAEGIEIPALKLVFILSKYS